jgi:cell wall-associated NlpC family hydrolase
MACVRLGGARTRWEDPVSAGKAKAAAGAALIATPALGVLVLALIAAASGALSPPPTPSAGTACSGPPVTAGKTVDGITLDAAQIGNAQVIYDVADGMQLPQQAAVIGIATAMQESTLDNIDYGDRDSLGLFQQRPSQGWGTPAEIMQPTYAATKFYDALVQVPSWQSLPVTVAAQDVQRSADPDAYAQWQSLATALADTFSGTATDCSTDADTSASVPASGTTRVPAGFTLPADTPATVRTAISYAIRQLGKPYIWGGTGPQGYDCSGLVMMAYQAAGISLPRTTFQQVDVGIPVYSLNGLQPGDLLFSAGADGTADDPGHVGMYIGSGLVIQAPETGKPIMITPLRGYWSEQTTATRRVAA